MDHAVECYGYLLQTPESSLLMCGDTTSSAGLRKIIPKARNLKAVILELSYPKRLANVAARSKHLSIDSFAKVADAVPEGVCILVSHMKPGYVHDIEKEIQALGLKNVSLLEQDKEYRL